MPRKYISTERFLKPDPRTGSLLVAKFINTLMYSGKKNAARNAFYECLDIIEKKVTDQPSAEIFTAAVNNVKPLVEVRSKRVGGANYQVPIEVKRNRQQALAFRWILEACRSRSGRPMSQRLAEEIMAAARKEGTAITKRENTHKMADANKMNAHFAW